MLFYLYPKSGMNEERRDRMVNTGKLKAVMVLRGYTQRRLAEETEISLTPLNEKINNKSVFRCDEVDKICTVLQITEAKEKCDIFFA